MNQAFGPMGPLLYQSVARGERENPGALRWHVYAVLRNPSGHREVRYDDVSEAADAVQTASLLMRMLDRIERADSQLGLAGEGSLGPAVVRRTTPQVGGVKPLPVARRASSVAADPPSERRCARAEVRGPS